MNTRLVMLVGLLVLAGCGLTGPRQAATWYVLEDQGRTAPAPRPAWQDTLLLRETDAPTFYQGPALIYSRAAGTRGQYQYARLTEWPAPRITQLLRQRLEQSALFQAVAPLGTGVSGGYQLNTRLLDFYHDATQAPGEVVLVLEAELIRRTDASLLGRTRIETRAAAASHDAAGAAGAANTALTLALDRITAWLARPL